MKVVLVLGSLLIPILMIVLQLRWSRFRILYNVVALLSALIFGNISSLAIHTIIKDETVFMTNIHALFLNPIFLITGAYLGVYLLYVIAVHTFSEMKQGA